MRADDVSGDGPGGMGGANMLCAAGWALGGCGGSGPAGWLNGEACEFREW